VVFWASFSFTDLKMNLQNLFFKWVVVFASLCLSACGGGNGDEAGQLCACYESALKQSGTELRVAIQDCDGQREKVKSAYSDDLEKSAQIKKETAACMIPLRGALAAKSRAAKAAAVHPRTAVQKRSKNTRGTDR
jgi:hypothetical protein